MPRAHARSWPTTAPVTRPSTRRRVDGPFDRLSTEPRLFVAVPIDEAARLAITRLVEPIQAAEPPGRGVRWVRLDGLHITLRFLGPTPEERVPDLLDAVAATATSQEPFGVRIDGAGAFPPAGRPRALWLGIRDGADRLAELAATLDEALVVAGWPAPERAFRAHLTLARADGVRVGAQTAAALREAAAGIDLPASVDRIVAFESVTGGGPARYVPRGEAALGRATPVLPSGRPRVGLRNRRQGAPHTS